MRGRAAPVEGAEERHQQRGEGKPVEERWKSSAQREEEGVTDMTRGGEFYIPFLIFWVFSVNIRLLSKLKKY